MIAELASKHTLHPNLITRSKQGVVEGLPGVFESKPAEAVNWVANRRIPTRGCRAGHWNPPETPFVSVGLSAKGPGSSFRKFE
jgi:hypothetical protein